jgi:hypothetical protein
MKRNFAGVVWVGGARIHSLSLAQIQQGRAPGPEPASWFSRHSDQRENKARFGGRD